MEPSEVINAFTSLDNHQAWLAGWEIIRSRNKDIEESYLSHLATIKSAVPSLPCPEGVSMRDSRDTPRLALRILEAVANGKCRCSAYGSTNQVLPESQEKYGLIEILEMIDIPWEPEFLCKCTDCSQAFKVYENHGYHYPWSKWSKTNA